jgi:hypothetical protein
MEIDVMHSKITWTVFSILLCATASIFAQSPKDSSPKGMPNEIPYSREFIAQKIIEHTESSEKFGASVIPEDVYFEILFTQALGDKEFSTIASPQDLEILRAAPARDDQSFVTKTYEELSGICDAWTQGTVITDIAFRFDQARKKSQANISQTYTRIFTRLSPEAKRYISEGKLALAQGQRLSYSRLNLEGIAEDMPEVAGDMMGAHCTKLKEALSRYVPQKRMLVNSLPQSTAILPSN